MKGTICKLITTVFGIGKELMKEKISINTQHRVLHLFFFSEICVSSFVLVYVHVSLYSQISPAAVDNVWGEVNHRAWDKASRRDEIVLLFPTEETYIVLLLTYLDLCIFISLIKILFFRVLFLYEFKKDIIQVYLQLTIFKVLKLFFSLIIYRKLCTLRDLNLNYRQINAAC